ncbi:MAG: RHS repeat-associated protein [Alteromonadaceae bacterium]|jgi:RHS repeat-associated protein
MNFPLSKKDKMNGDNSIKKQINKWTFKMTVKPLVKLTAVLSGLLLSIFYSSSVVAASIITSLAVSGNVATFTTQDAKPTSTLGCGNENSWVVATNDNSGLYELLTIAQKSQQPIEVESAGSCLSNTEKAGNINVNYPYSDIVKPSIASNLNFVARTSIEMKAGETVGSVTFTLTSTSGYNKIETPIHSGDYYTYDFGQLPVGTYSLETLVTSGTEAETATDTATFTVVPVNLVDIYQLNGKLYLQLPATHGDKYLELTKKSDGSWSVIVIDETTWNNIKANFSPANYNIDFADFNNDNLQDFRLTSLDGATVITVAQTDTAYDVVINSSSELLPIGDLSAKVTSVVDASKVILPRPASTDKVGQLQGFADISGGNVNYSIPIQLPPGRQGMQPLLSLNYNSAAGNGITGKGWQLSGQSAIARCSANWTEDGKVDRVDLKNNDVLCLDGQKLVLVSGSYGAQSSEYRTLNDSFNKITLKGAAYSSSSSYFEVISKNGQVSYYGNTSDSILLPTGGTTPLRWAINKVYDNAVVQNNIKFSYTSANGEQLLTDIHYTGQNDSDGSRHVKFSYDNRDDVSFGYINETSTKSTQKLTAIATYIDAAASSDGTQVFNYDLQYEVANSPITGFSRLASVQQCGFEGGIAQCLPQKEFTYSGDALIFAEVASANAVFNTGFPWSISNQKLGDFNSDGVIDFARNDQLHLMSFENNNYVIDKVINLPFKPAGIAQDPRELVKLGTLDFNNDGQLDLIGVNNSGHLSVAMFDGALNSFDEVDLGINMVCAALTTYARLYNYDISVNVSLQYKNACRAEPVSDGTGGYYLFHRSSLADMYLSRLHPTCTDNLCSTQLIPGIDKSAPGVLPSFWSEPSGYQIFDFDGDGDPDIVQLEETSHEQNAGIKLVWFRNDQSGTGTSATNNFVKVTTTLPNVTKTYGLGTGGNHWIDANGDGLKDLLVNSGNWYLFINEGGKLASPVNTGIAKFYRSIINEFFGTSAYEGPEHSTHASIRILDFNGDGLEDFMFLDRNVHPRDCLSDRERAYCKEGNGSESAGSSDFTVSPLAFGNYSVYISSIDNQGTVSFTKQETDIQGSQNYLYPIDMNNDGTMDFIGAIWQDDGTTIDNSYHPQETYFYLGQSDSKGIAADLLTLVQDDSAVSSYGQRDEFSYQAFSHHKKSTTGSSAVDNSGLAGKYYYRIPSTQMVAIKHNIKNNNAGTNTVNYTYGDPIYHQAGLGFLGFESISEIDVAQGITATANYLMDYPLNGKVSQQNVYKTSGSGLLQSKVNTWCNRLTTDCDGSAAGTYFTHLNKSVANYYDPQGNALKTETVTNNSFDAYGNLTQQTSVLSDTTMTHTTVADNVYNAVDTVLWWVNKLDYADISKSVDYVTNNGVLAGTNGTKTKRRTVTWKNNDKRQLASEVFTASDTQHQASTTYNSYDSYNNLTKVTQGGSADSGVAYTDVQVNSISEYDYTAAEGYFANTEKNGLWAEDAVTRRWNKAFGLVDKQTDINGLVIDNTYDVFGRLSQIDSSSAPAQDFIYQWCTTCITNAVFKVTKVQDGSPIVTEEVNRQGQVLKRTSSAFNGNSGGNQTTIATYTYDALGRLTQQSYPHFVNATAATESFTGYDVLNRYTNKVVAMAPQNYNITYGYTGLKTDITVDAGADGSRTMARSYNALNLLISTQDANTEFTHYQYDANGNPIVIKDVANNVITAKYDGFGYKQTFNDPNAGDWQFRYNGLGQLRWQQDGNLKQTRFDYDGLGRLTNRYLDNVSDTSWLYDSRKKGALSTETRGDLIKNHYYDSQVRVIKENSTISHDGGSKSFDMEYAYDGYYGKVKALRYPSGEMVALNYDNYGFNSQDVNPNDINTVYRTVGAMSQHGKISSQLLGNGLYSNSQHTVSGDITRVCVNNSDSCAATANLDEIYYSDYDNFGNLKTQIDVVYDIQESFVYDNLHRIDSSTRSATGVLSPAFQPAFIDYNYDKSGNLLKKTDYATSYNYTVTNSTTGGPNAVKSIVKLDQTTVNFAYDDNGNLTTGDGINLSYNSFNKPISISRNGSTLAFKYGADNKRYLQTATQSGKTVTTYYVGKLFELVETTEGGTTSTEKRHYLGDYGVLTHQGENKHLAYQHRDRLGSVSLVTKGYLGLSDVGNSAELVLERRGYDVFGKPRDLYWSDSTGGIIGSSISNRGFTDHEHLDDVQLIHMNGRGFDYNLGRFLSIDPFIQMPANSQSINPYSYGMNNPLAGTDPSGYLFWFIPVIIEVGSGAMALYGAWESGQTIGGAINDIVSGESSTIDVVTNAAKDLAVDAAITVTGARLAKLVPETMQKKAMDLLTGKGKGNGGDNSAKMETGKIADAGVGSKAVKPGDEGTYGELKSIKRKFGETEPLDMDHQPSFAAQVKATEKELGVTLSKSQLSKLKANTPAVASPRKIHQQTSPTYGGRNTQAKSTEDAVDLGAARKRDKAVFNDALKKRGEITWR